jgi:hypothetical protein
VTQICNALTAHAQIKEEILFPALNEWCAQQMHALVAEATEEYKVAKTLVAEIRVMSGQEEQCAAKVAVLAEDAQPRVKEEAKEIFPKARQHLSGKRVAELGLRIAAGHQELHHEAVTEYQAAEQEDQARSSDACHSLLTVSTSCAAGSSRHDLSYRHRRHERQTLGHGTD